MCVVGHTSRNINAERVINDTAVFAAAFEGRYHRPGQPFRRRCRRPGHGHRRGDHQLWVKMAEDEEMLARVEQYKTGPAWNSRRPSGRHIPRTMGSEKETFLGERACMSCHEDAWKVYLDSPHRAAFATIRNKGQSFEPECLSCHTTGYQHKNGYSDEPPVQQADQRPVRGLPRLRQPSTRATASGSAQAKDSCTMCHDQKNSPEFDYATYWEKIKH